LKIFITIELNGKIKNYIFIKIEKTGEKNEIAELVKRYEVHENYF
jgi:hypothetical protein